GYYAMAGQGFDPDFIVSWPTGRMGVMEGESAIQAVYGADAAKPDNAAAVDAMRADYEHQLDAKFAGARGFVDAILTPDETRDISAEGRVPLTAFPVPTDKEMKGAARIGRLTTATTWYRGVFRELPLGRPPAGDVNGNGRNTDEFPVVVVRASDGWVAFIDTN